MEVQPDKMRTYDQIRILWRDACATVVRDIVADAFDISPARLVAKERGREYVARARHVALYLTHVVCQLPYREVGLAFGRDRSSVAYACARIEDMRDDEYVDITLDLMTEVIEARVRQIRVDSLLSAAGGETAEQEAEAGAAMPAPALEKARRAVVGGEDLDDLPLIETARGRLLEVKWLK